MLDSWGKRPGQQTTKGKVMNAAIAQHLNVAQTAILEIQEWASVLWVRVQGLGARFVSKKVIKMSVYDQIKQEFEIALESVIEALPKENQPANWPDDKRPTYDFYWNIVKKSGDTFSADAVKMTMRLPSLNSFADRMAAYNKKRIAKTTPQFDHFLDRDEWDEYQA